MRRSRSALEDLPAPFTPLGCRFDLAVKPPRAQSVQHVRPVCPRENHTAVVEKPSIQPTTGSACSRSSFPPRKAARAPRSSDRVDFIDEDDGRRYARSARRGPAPARGPPQQKTLYEIGAGDEMEWDACFAGGHLGQQRLPAHQCCVVNTPPRQTGRHNTQPRPPTRQANTACI
jgi:hypothetical protein